MAALLNAPYPRQPAGGRLSAREPTGGVLAWAGVAAALVYLATVVIGALVTPGYSHLTNAISELLVVGAPYRAALNAAFALYNLLIVAFALDLIRRSIEAGRSAIVIGGGLLIAMAVAGLTMSAFPMDPIGAAPTFVGVGHIVLAGLASLASIGSLLALALGLRTVPNGARWAAYTLLSLAVTFASGAVAALSAVQLWPTMGLWERVTIAAHVQWVLVMAIALATGRLALGNRRGQTSAA